MLLAFAHDFISAFPTGYDTEIGEMGIKLSGGQRQRIDIARVFLNDPPIVIFDEATTVLDHDTEKSIQQNIEPILKDRTAIVMTYKITYKLFAIQNSHLLVVLDEGRVVEHRNHRELLAFRGLYYGGGGQEALKNLEVLAPLASGHPELEGIIPEAERAIQKLQN